MADNDCHHCRVVIIGAGIAGVAAANWLSNEGFDDFVILESTDRIGGRIWSIDLETNMGHRVELGANWIHGIDLNPIFVIATQNKLLSIQYEGRNLGKKMIFTQECGDPVNPRVVQEVDFQYGQLMSECEDFFRQQIPPPFENDSVGSYIEREFDERMSRYHDQEYTLRRRVFCQRMLGECIISGANSLHDIALSEVGCFEDLPGVHYVIPPGFEAVIDILRQNFDQNKILLNHIVTQIKWNQGGSEVGNNAAVCVECSNGKRFYADMCLVTISLGYLKKHAERLFDPVLPEFKMNAINRIAMGTVNKVILEFDGQVFPNGVFRLEMVWDRINIESEPIEENWVKKFGCFEAVSDNVLMGWISGTESEYMETLSDEVVGRKCVEALSKFLSKTVKVLPKLKKVTRSFWKSNPYTLGAYCHIPVGVTSEEIHNMAEPVNDKFNRTVLLFAGEATHPTFYSSAHGSLLTGRTQAEKILELVTRY